MKKISFGLLAVAILFSVCLPVSAHPGRTDSQGGHYDRSTGEYHFHHGYPAHQHTDGVCPYDFDDKTGESSGEGTGNKSSETSEIYPAYQEDENGGIDGKVKAVIVILLLVLVGYPVVSIVIPLCVLVISKFMGKLSGDKKN